MKKHPYLPAGLIGILDLVLIALTAVLLATAPKPREAAAGTAASGSTQTAEEEAAESHTSSYAGLITAETSSTPTPTPTAAPEPTATPTTTPTAAPTSTPTPEAEETSDSAEMSDADFIFPSSSTQQLTEAQIRAAVSTKAQCQRAINEIYARHGYLFHREKNADDYDYFNSLGWYQAMSKVDSASAVEAGFNSVEKANINLLLSVRSTMSS